MNLITVLAFTSDDSAHADALLSLITALNSGQPQGHLLMVAAPDVHGELTAKLTVSAELAFASVDVLSVPWPPNNNAQAGKYALMNHVFRTAAANVAERYKSTGWLWIEPDCVPLCPLWFDSISDAYFEQPRRYMGAVMADTEGRTSMDRVGVYPTNAFIQLTTFFDQQAPFNLQAGNVTVKRCTKSKLFQVMRYTAETERSKVREDAVLLHGDKEGVLLSVVKEELKNGPADQPLIDAMSDVLQGRPITHPVENLDDKNFGDPAIEVPPPPSLNANTPPKSKPGRPAKKKTEPVAA